MRLFHETYAMRCPFGNVVCIVRCRKRKHAPFTRVWHELRFSATENTNRTVVVSSVGILGFWSKSEAGPITHASNEIIGINQPGTDPPLILMIEFHSFHGFIQETSNMVRLPNKSVIFRGCEFESLTLRYPVLSWRYPVLSWRYPALPGKAGKSREKPGKAGKSRGNTTISSQKCTPWKLQRDCYVPPPDSLRAVSEKVPLRALAGVPPPTLSESSESVGKNSERGLLKNPFK